MSFKHLVCVAVLFSLGTCVRENDVHESMALETDTPLDQLVPVFKAAYANMDRFYKAYTGSGGRTDDNFVALEAAEKAASAQLVMHDDLIKSKQLELDAAFKKHKAVTAEAKAMEAQVNAAQAIVSREEEARKRRYETRQTALANLKVAAESAKRKLDEVVPEMPQAPTLDHMGHELMTMESAENSLEAAISTMSDTTDISRQEEGESVALEPHYATIRRGLAHHFKVEQTRNEFTSTENEVAAFLESVVEVKMLAQDAKNALETTRCPAGTFSADHNGHTRCTQCADKGREIVDHAFGSELTEQYTWFSKLSGRKTQEEVVEALTFTSEKGSDFEDCEAYLCCCKRDLLPGDPHTAQGCAFVPKEHLSAQWGCPAAFPVERKTCNAQRQGNEPKTCVLTTMTACDASR